MMTVRFPNGQTVQYNDAWSLLRTENGWILKTKENGSLIAFIQSSAGAIVEFVAPCRVYDALSLSKQEALERQIATLTREVRSLKRKLGCFDGH